MESRSTMAARPARWALRPNPRLRAAAPVALLLLLGGLPACNERHPVMSSPSPEVEEALLRMDEARCERAARCDRMGSAERFPSRAACIWTMRQNDRRDVDLYLCPKGVEEARLRACIDSIRATSCEPATLDLAEREPCAGQRLCPSQGEPRTSPGIAHPSSNAVD